MNHHTTPKFWACYRELPVEVQSLADKCFELAKEDSSFPTPQEGRPFLVGSGRPVLAIDCALAGAQWAPCSSAELGRYVAELSDG